MRWALAAVALGGGIAACAAFGSSDDGNAPDVKADAGADGTVPTPIVNGPDGGAIDSGSSGAPDSGTSAFVRGFSKTVSFEQETDGGGGTFTTIQRPPNTQPGDVLVLFIFNNEGGAPTVDKSFTPLIQGGQCPDVPNVGHQALWRIDDNTPSYQFATPVGPTTLEAMLVAVANVDPPSDFQISDAETSVPGGEAPSVVVQSPQGFVLVAFSSTYVPQVATPDKGLTLIDTATVSASTLQVYGGLFPSGRTPTFGPYTDAAPCWGALSVELPSH